MLVAPHELSELSGDGRCVVQLVDALMQKNGLVRGAHEEDEGAGDEGVEAHGGCWGSCLEKSFF